MRRFHVHKSCYNIRQYIIRRTFASNDNNDVGTSRSYLYSPYASMIPKLKQFEDGFWAERRQRQENIEKEMERTGKKPASFVLNRYKFGRETGNWGVFTLCSAFLASYIGASWLLEQIVPTPRTSWYHEVYPYYQELERVRACLTDWSIEFVRHSDTNTSKYDIHGDINSTLSISGIIQQCQRLLDKSTMTQANRTRLQNKLYNIQTMIDIASAQKRYLNAKWLHRRKDHTRLQRNICLASKIVCIYFGIVGGVYVGTMIGTYSRFMLLGVEFACFSGLTYVAFNFRDIVPNQDIYAYVDERPRALWNDLLLEHNDEN